MFEKKTNRWGIATLTFVLGATAGAIAALMLAPMKGKRMQKRVAHVVDAQLGNVERFVKKVVNA